MNDGEIANWTATHQGPACVELEKSPPPERWNDWVEYDAGAWPRQVEKHYAVIPTTCSNCPAACGLLAFVDKEDWTIRRMEGNPLHPASRGRLCAMGPATVSQIRDPERILYPLKRTGKRGEGKWRRIGWEQVLQELSAEIRTHILEGRRDEVVFHCGTADEDGFRERVLQSWGVDGSCGNTNICSAAARLGFDLWQGSDQSSPDFGEARFIFLIGSHLEGGHYFNPHAQRIIDAKMKGCRIAVMDPRLSNTASMADYWLAPYPGTETAVLLAIARILLEEDLADKDFVRRWTNWRQYMAEERARPDAAFEDFIACLKEHYAAFTPELAEAESGIHSGRIVELAREIGRARSAFAFHVWGSAAGGSLGGWQLARALELIAVLAGSIGTRGGTSPAAWCRFVPVPFSTPEPQDHWNELLWPREYPLAHYDMSFLLPFYLKERRGRIGVFFSGAGNPVWANPDGASWMEILRDEEMIGLHAALASGWDETAWLADYVLPMGGGGERHDLQSRETHAGLWIALRQPVLRIAREMAGERFDSTYQANAGEVWEENEFLIGLSWLVDADGAMGIRRHFESPYRTGERLEIEEYYRWIFENSVPGLPEAAAGKGLAPLEYMQKYGAFEMPGAIYDRQRVALRPEQLEGSRLDQLHRVVVGSDESAAAVGTLVDGELVEGFATPSRRLEFFSSTMREWGWPEHSVPAYTRSHVYWRDLDREKGEYLLIPGFSLPVLTRQSPGNAKWLNELAHANPVWIHPEDAASLGLSTGDLVKVNTEIGYFVTRVWITEGIRPGVVACSHLLGHWRVLEQEGSERSCSALVRFKEELEGVWHLRQLRRVQAFASEDPDSARIWWREAGVHQNLAMAPHPDPVSGMQCWHQRVRIERPSAGEKYGDICVDTKRSYETYREWLALTRPAPGPGGLRRPLWLTRPLRPGLQAFHCDERLGDA